MTDADTSIRKPYIAPRVIHQGESTPDAPFAGAGFIADSTASESPTTHAGGS